MRKYQYLYLEIPKKNGKSELAAALGLCHLFADGEMSAEVYVCAADRENADIVFLAAVFMLESAPWTAKMVASGELKIIRSKRRIEFRQKQWADNGRVDWVMVGRFQVLSAEAYSKHGYRPSCVIFDELHSQRAGFLTLCEGDMVDYRDVTAAVLEAAKLYDLQALGLDQHLTQTITPALQDAGILVMAIPQTMMGMSPAMKELEQLIRRREMLHVHNTCARWNFGNVRCAVDGNENIKPMKNHSTGRIDITVSWIIAMAAAMQRRNAKPDLAQAMRTRHYHL